jgi:hypothetical protein
MATTPMSDARASRAGKNQSLFRDVNERVREMNERLDPALPLSEWLCECADDSCTDRIELTQDAYSRVREHGKRFVVAPGHVFAGIEEIVERQQVYWIVEKVGEAGIVAESFNLRSRGVGAE